MALVLGGAALLLVLLSTAFQMVRWFGGHTDVHGLVRLTFVGKERNLPTLFSSLILAAAGLCCGLVAAVVRARKLPDLSKWVVLAIGFIYLACDEELSFHEKMSAPVRRLLGTGVLGIQHAYWIIPAFAGVLVVGLFYAGFLWRLPSRTRNLFLLSGAMYVGGAVGIEQLSYAFAFGHGKGFLFCMIVTLEESLEMAGVIVFIYALLDHLARTVGEVRFLLADGTEGPARDPFAKSPGIAYKAPLPGA